MALQHQEELQEHNANSAWASAISGHKRVDYYSNHSANVITEALSGEEEC